MVLVIVGALLRTRDRVPDLVFEGDLSEVDTASDDRWKVLSPSRALVALVTSATLAELAPAPGATRRLLHGLYRQHDRNLELRAIVGIYDVEERITAFFDHLARHVGLPEGDATRIPLALEQRRVEEILGAGHTQATTAFRSLVRAGILVHDAAGWLLACSAPNTSARPARSAPNPIAADDGSGLPLVTPAA